MKKFEFRLSSFLRVKEFEEKNAWNEVLQQENRVVNLKRRIDTLHEGVHESRLQLSDARIDAGAAARWQWAEESIRGMNAQIDILEKEYALEMKTLERLANRHREIKREAKVLSNYKDRKKTEFVDHKNHLEEIRLTETATQSFIRKTK